MMHTEGEPRPNETGYWRILCGVHSGQAMRAVSFITVFQCVLVGQINRASENVVVLCGSLPVGFVICGKAISTTWLPLQAN